MMASRTSRSDVENNIRIHDRIAGRYDRTHSEIFNPVEQDRLREALARAMDGVRGAGTPLRALDFGCGSGNLTRHLLALGADVTAADVSPAFLSLVERTFAGAPLRTYRLNGENLAGLADAAFDLVATYSVLHHVPDYLGALREMARVTRPGGVILVDHEVNPGYWRADPVYREFLKRGRRTDWRKFLVPENYYGKIRRLFDPKYSNEGDIHVWPDDHIEWGRIEETLGAEGFEILFREDYLACRSGYRADVYQQYRSKCSDMRVMALRKGG